MIIGSGLLAQAFSPEYLHREDVCIYAAGVSNSGCADDHEFARERQRLMVALKQTMCVDAFVYFGTCSVDDPEARKTPYVQHKLAMEQLVSEHPRSLILRLPNIAGRTPNPHTVLNYLYARISRSESFKLWSNAKRNIVDVDDAVAIAQLVIAHSLARNVTINIANAFNYPITDIVSTMERVVGKPAIYDVVERGAEYLIDIRVISPMLERAGVIFSNDYLEKVIDRYYGKYTFFCTINHKSEFRRK